MTKPTNTRQTAQTSNKTKLETHNKHGGNKIKSKRNNKRPETYLLESWQSEPVVNQLSPQKPDPEDGWMETNENDVSSNHINNHIEMYQRDSQSFMFVHIGRQFHVFLFCFN